MAVLYKQELPALTRCICRYVAFTFLHHQYTGFCSLDTPNCLICPSKRPPTSLSFVLYDSLITLPLQMRSEQKTHRLVKHYLLLDTEDVKISFFIVLDTILSLPLVARSAAHLRVAPVNMDLTRAQIHLLCARNLRTESAAAALQHLSS